jgi:hypothetical protein
VVDFCHAHSLTETVNPSPNLNKREPPQLAASFMSHVSANETFKQPRGSAPKVLEEGCTSSMEPGHKFVFQTGNGLTIRQGTADRLYSVRNESLCRRVAAIPATQHRCRMNDEPTQEQLQQLKRLSKEARVPDVSEIVTTKEEADIRIRDLKEKARME